MNQNILMGYEYKGYRVRTHIINGKLWFVAGDICDVLGLKHEIVRRLDDDEKGLNKIQTPGGMQSVVIINEPGMYSLILRSNKPEAKTFRKWITKVVIPAIREHGYYGDIKKAVSRLEMAQMWYEAEVKLEKLEAQIEEDEPYTEFGKEFASSEGTVLMRDVAKAIGTGQNKLWAFLRRIRVMNDRNRPYQRFFDAGYFVDSLGTHDEDDVKVSHRTVRVTTKGQVYIAKLWNQQTAEPKLIPLM